jgi:hypothetical protein
VLDLEGRAERVELVRARRCTLAQAEEPIRELLAVVGKNGADADSLPGRALQSNVPRGGQARSRSRRKRRALAAVLAVKMRMKTQRVARSIATKR